MKAIKQYQCELCGQVYDNQADAESCEAQDLEEPIVEVGDFVVTDREEYGRFGWFDGDSEWAIEKERGLHGPARTYSLIYVVTAITYDDPYNPHLCCYHLETKAMTGDGGHRQGYTFPATHFGIHKVEADVDGSDLIGHVAKWLL